MYARANLDFNALEKLADRLQEFGADDIAYYNDEVSAMPWSGACTVRLCIKTTTSPGTCLSKEEVKEVIKITNSLNQDNIGYLAWTTNDRRVSLAYTFILPPKDRPPGG